MSRTVRAKPQGENAALRTRLERAEKIISALVADTESIKQRLAKVEVVRTPSPTTTEPELPFNEQKPETE